MKKIFLFAILIISLLFFSGAILADSEHNHQSEIEEGKSLVESKISCDELNDEQLEAIGEYLMEQMHPGQSHEAMHKMMGIEEGTENHKQFHVNMAKMMYCGGNGAMGISMMGSNGIRGNLPNSMMNNMMGSWSIGVGWGWFGWIFMILFWALIVVGIIALIKWIADSTRGEAKSKSALDILKERYAKGEISKEEFEEKKKDLI